MLHFPRSTALSLAALVSISGCVQPPARPVNVSIHLLCGWDTSGSNRSGLPAQVRAGVRLLRELRRAGGTATLYRVDHDVEEIFDGEPQGSRERCEALLIRELSALPATPGTHPEAFWRNVAAALRHLSEPVIVVLFTDGERDDVSPAATRELKQALAQLAAEPQVKRVCLIGVRSCCRLSLRREFASFGERLWIGSSEYSSQQFPDLISAPASFQR